jgi:predicted nucleic acid-binding protein
LTELGSSSEPPLSLVLDTSVAVKWYLPEELHDEAISLLRRAEAGDVELLAPGTVQPELFNASSMPFGGSIAEKVYRSIVCVISGDSLLWIRSYCTRPRT